MFSQIELFLLGVSTVIDSVLLLIILERVNRPQVAGWLYGLLGGLWLIHSASFAQAVLRDVQNVQWANSVCLTGICVGLMILPSAMLHAALWLNFGQQAQKRRYLIAYGPLLLIPWIAQPLWTTESPTFVESVQPFASWYLIWIACVNCAAILLFLRVSKRSQLAGAAQFFPRLAFLIALMTVAVIGYYQVIAHESYEAPWRLVLILTPLLPALLFVWYSLNQRLLPLVMERTLVYGAFLVTLLFLHRLLVEPLASAMQERTNVDILLIEGWLLVGLILIWRPLRTRFREAVRYLMSSNVHHIRDATRRLSVELSQLESQSTDELVDWMNTALQTGLQVEFAQVWLDDDQEPNSTEAGDLSVLHSTLHGQSEPLLKRGQSSAANVEAAMIRLGAMWAFRLHFRTIRGVVLIGPRLRCDRLADEQLIALSLLFEQFAATLHNRQLDLRRLRAERQTMQQEKLSVLGLIAGSLAHELRNPLSSVRTIATLMLEDMGCADRHARDVTMIVGEMDRLTQATQRLLDYSRPSNDKPGHVQPDRVVSRLLYILEHLARQCHVRIETLLAAGDQSVATSDATLSEILFNLIKNGIEAACCGPHGMVTIETSSSREGVRIIVRDNGPGIDDATQATMFQPFVTGKTDGTGLGLYIVSERIKELGGTISCTSQLGGGTQFEVLLSCRTQSSVVPLSQLLTVSAR